ncbi:MAG: hypothetical protein ACLQLH_03595 [Terracidiphilus sp.]
MENSVVDTRSKALQNKILPSLANVFASSKKKIGLTKALTILSLFYERPVTKEVQEVYWEALEDLTPEQLAQAFSRVTLEQKFWPSPAVLRSLAGVETFDELRRKEAMDGLHWLLGLLRRHDVELRPTETVVTPAGRDGNGKWREATYTLTPAPEIPDEIRATLSDLGCGDRKAGAELIARHPALSRNPDEYETLGFRLSAEEKLEARWLAAWRKVNR